MKLFSLLAFVLAKSIRITESDLGSTNTIKEGKTCVSSPRRSIPEL